MPDPIRGRATGLPPLLTRRELRVFTTADAADVYAHLRPQFARLVDAGLLRRLHPGLYAVVPAEHVGDGMWRPPLEAAAGAIAGAMYGPDRAVVVGLAAACLHHAVPRALGRATVAVPHWRRPMHIVGTGWTVRFVQRDTDRLDAELIKAELGPILVSTPEQTLGDLQSGIDGQSSDVADAVTALSATIRHRHRPQAR